MMVRGRQQFNKVKPVITILRYLMGKIPLNLRIKYFNHLRYYKGKLGIGLRYVTLASISPNIGDNVSIHEGVFLFNPEKISIGNNVSIHPMCYIEAYGGIKIGDNVSIAHSATLLSVNHKYDSISIPIKDQGLISESLIIENNVWVGAKATILGGNIINEGCVIAAGCVVTKSFEKNQVLAGVPAKTIMERK